VGDWPIHFVEQSLLKARGRLLASTMAISGRPSPSRSPTAV
jgi:hypothetical protein